MTGVNRTEVPFQLSVLPTGKAPRRNFPRSASRRVRTSFVCVAPTRLSVNHLNRKWLTNIPGLFPNAPVHSVFDLCGLDRLLDRYRLLLAHPPLCCPKPCRCRNKKSLPSLNSRDDGLLKSGAVPPLLTSLAGNAHLKHDDRL